jgi:hypothetical protein
MAFKCIYQLNNGTIKESDEIIFIEYIDTPFGHFQKETVQIAKAMFNGSPAYVYSNCPGVPIDKGYLKSGDRIFPDTEIAYFAAEGEDIPYNRPYATIKTA